MTDAAPADGPLAGIRVIELGQYISGPYAGKLLADLGADVVKVESPEGDPMRRWQGGERGHSPQFEAYNRGKRAVTLNLKDDGESAALRDLLRVADIVIENFRPGVAERLGFGFDTLHEANPRLVYCSVTGFGSTGPYAARPSYDTVISAIGGMYSQVMALDAPRPVGPAFSDLLSGVFAAQAVLAALVARDRDGTGQKVEVSMVGALLDFLVEPATTFLETGAVAGPDSRPRRAQSYACTASDGLAFVVHLSVPEKFWSGLLAVLDRADLADDPRFRSREARVEHYDDLDAIIKAEVGKRPREEWFGLLDAADIPHGPLNTFGDIFDDPQIAHMDLVRGRAVRPTTKYSNSAPPDPRPAPAERSEFADVYASWTIDGRND